MGRPLVDNLLAGCLGVSAARPVGLRIEADFVTCTQCALVASCALRTHQHPCSHAVLGPHGFIGKNHILTAIEHFHAAHPTVALEVNVTRHPYSFHGDSNRQQSRAENKGHKRPLSTWHDGLLGYVGGDAARRDAAEDGLRQQGRAAGIEFDFDVPTDWQPVDSQRLLLWAGRFGLQEPFMSELNSRHFQNARRGTTGESASSRATLLESAAAVGLDAAAAEAFLVTDELKDDVWRSYGDTIHRRGISAIPLFVFNVPEVGIVGGPFREFRQAPWTLNGSMDPPAFLAVFEAALKAVLARRGALADEAAPAHAPSPDLTGLRVFVTGLVGRPELNGREGVATRYDGHRGRYVVRLAEPNEGGCAAQDASAPAEFGESVLLRPTNLERPAAAAVEADAVAEGGAAPPTPPKPGAALGDEDYEDYEEVLSMI